MDVVTFDVHPDAEAARSFGFRYAPLEQGLAEAEVVTPHDAYNTQDALGRIIRTTLHNIDAFTRSTPVNVVLGTKRSAPTSGPSTHRDWQAP